MHEFDSLLVLVVWSTLSFTLQEKDAILEDLNAEKDKSAELLTKLQEAAIRNKNIFGLLMEAGKACSLGEITNALFEVGGQYRRNM